MRFSFDPTANHPPAPVIQLHGQDVPIVDQYEYLGWRTRYINYSKLKKFVRKSELAREKHSSNSSHRTPTPASPVSEDGDRYGDNNEDDADGGTDADVQIGVEEGNEYLSLLTIDFEADEDFFTELIKQLRKVNRFYIEQE
eukprot:jgi/Hompol1/3764/HPOL_006728-RA